MRRALLASAILIFACGDTTTDEGTPQKCAVELEAVGLLARSVGAQEQEELAVLLRDCRGPIEGAAVKFAILDPANGARLTNSEASTDARGVAATILVAGAISATLIVEANYSDRVYGVEFTVSVSAAPDPCEGHCSNGSVDCGETGLDCGGPCVACDLPVDDADVESHSLPSEMVCMTTLSAALTMHNSGTTAWTSEDYALGYVGDGAHPFLASQAPTRIHGESTVAPGAAATFLVSLQAPMEPGQYDARFQMVTEGGGWFGEIASRSITVTPCEVGGCSFPIGVPDEGFIASASSTTDTDPIVDDAVNAAMAELTGCGVHTSCPLTGFAGGSAEEVCQSWFSAVNERLREQGLCAGLHVIGSTDEIAVSNAGCTEKWYGYHVCYYGGPSVVWNPGARRGWWQIAPEYCE